MTAVGHYLYNSKAGCTKWTALSIHHLPPKEQELTLPSTYANVADQQDAHICRSWGQWQEGLFQKSGKIISMGKIFWCPQAAPWLFSGAWLEDSLLVAWFMINTKSYRAPGRELDEIPVARWHSQQNGCSKWSVWSQQLGSYESAAVSSDSHT